MKPTLGRIVLYKSKIDNGPGNDVLSPAMVIRTRETTVLEVLQRWTSGTQLAAMDGELYQVGNRPDGLVEELPDDFTVDLVVFGLGKTYREYAVPHGDRRGQWDWPPRQPVYCEGRALD